jgi:hypothetical protein
MAHNLETEFKEGVYRRIGHVRSCGLKPIRKRILNRPLTATHVDVIPEKVFIHAF